MPTSPAGHSISARPRAVAGEKQHHQRGAGGAHARQRQVGKAGAEVATSPGAAREESVQGSKGGSRFRKFYNGDHRDPWPILRNELADHCFWKHPAWTAYLKQIRMMRNGSAPQRYLTWSSGRGQGIGNSLQGLLTSFYLAFMSGRDFKINWGSVGLERAFGVQDIDWRLSSSPQVHKLPSKRALYYDFDPVMNGRQVSNMAYSKEPNMWLETNVVANRNNLLVKNKMLGVNFPNVTWLDLVTAESQLQACAFHSLFKLPKDWLKSETPPPGPQIGIHLRFGDSVMGMNARDKREGMFAEVPMAQMAVTCAQQLAAQAGFKAPCLIIMESDSEKAKKAAASTEGLCKVWISHQMTRHTAGGAGSDGSLATWYAWARLTAVEILLFTGSTFSRTAGNVGASAAEKRRLIGFKKFLPKQPTGSFYCNLSESLEPR